MEKIKQKFDDLFRRYGIELPLEHLLERKRGSLQKNGWTIRFHFGEEGGRAYLEYFSTHRMTNDTLERIYEDGEHSVVGYCQEFFVAGDVQSAKAYYEHNRAFYQRVKDLGLDA